MSIKDVAINHGEFEIVIAVIMFGIAVPSIFLNGIILSLVVSPIVIIGLIARSIVKKEELSTDFVKLSALIFIAFALFVFAIFH